MWQPAVAAWDHLLPQIVAKNQCPLRVRSGPSEKTEMTLAQGEAERLLPARSGQRQSASSLVSLAPRYLQQYGRQSL